MRSHSKLLCFLIILLTATACSFSAEPNSIGLNANQMSIATGQPSLVLMSSGSTHIPVWSLSGGTVGQSVAGVVTGLPSDCAVVKVEIVVTTTDETTSPEFADVYRVHLSQMVDGAPFTERYALGKTVRTALPAAPFHSRTIVLESCYEVVPDAPLTVRIQREPGDPGDTFIKPTGLAAVKVTPLKALPEPHVVQDVPGYNSWPMIQAIGGKLVCVYGRGKGHTIGSDDRAVYARTSTDGGKTWTAETVVADAKDYGEVAVGKGLDATGAMLLWVRRIGKKRMAPQSLPQHRRSHLHARRDADARRAPDADHRCLQRAKSRTHGPVVRRRLQRQAHAILGHDDQQRRRQNVDPNTCRIRLAEARLAHRTRRGLPRRWQNPRHRADRDGSRAVPDRLHRLRCHLEAHSHQHQRCHRLHAEPDP